MTSLPPEVLRPLQQLHGVAMELRPWTARESKQAKSLTERVTAITKAFAEGYTEGAKDGETARTAPPAADVAFVSLRQFLRGTEENPQAVRQLFATREKAKALMQTLCKHCGVEQELEETPREPQPWPRIGTTAKPRTPTIHLTTVTDPTKMTDENTSPPLSPEQLAQTTIDHCRDGIAMDVHDGGGDCSDSRDEVLWIARTEDEERAIRIAHSKWGMSYTDTARGEQQHIGYYNRRLIHDHDTRPVERWLTRWAEHAVADQRGHRLTGELDGSYTPAETKAMFGIDDWR